MLGSRNVVRCKQYNVYANWQIECSTFWMRVISLFDVVLVRNGKRLIAPNSPAGRVFIHAFMRWPLHHFRTKFKECIECAKTMRPI